MMRLKQPVARTVRLVQRAVHAVAQDIRRPPYVPPGHFYSPRTSDSDVEHAIAGRRNPVGVKLHEQEQLDLARVLQLATPLHRRWEPNTMYGSLNAAVLQAMLIEMRPSHFVEVGSGFSTAVALDVADEDVPGLRVTCVEPYPKRLLSRLRPGDQDRLTLLQSRVQDLDPRHIADQLRPGDVLFIDSTHVVKPGSDVVWLMLTPCPC